jgi:hypothetical protein
MARLAFRVPLIGYNLSKMPGSLPGTSRVPAAKPSGAAICPAIPIKDFVPFATMTFSIFVARVEAQAW